MNWSVTESGPLDAVAVDRLGNELLVGNGYLGYRGTLEEYTAEQKVATIVSGLYDQVGEAWREPVNLPNGAFFELEYGGVRLHALDGRTRSHAQRLDLRGAIHERSTAFATADGNTIRVESRRFASLERHHLLCIEYTVEAARDCSLVVRSGIDGDVWDLNGPHLREFDVCETGGLVALTARTHESGVPIAVAEYLARIDGEPTCERAERRIVRRFALALRAGEPHTFVKLVAVHTGLDSDDPLGAALRSCRDAADAGWTDLLAAHRARWAARWRDCDIQIDGDEAGQLALRFSMYHLLAIAPSDAENISIPARGLSGQVYKGAVFWDTEIFMLPFFVFEFPSLARNLLLYRYHTLDGARRKAHEYGYRGAFFAWESQDTGDDACTLFNVTDVFTGRPMRTYFRDKQFHISADVAYAIWQYCSITGDMSILLDGGAEVIFECARFFVSASVFNHDLRRYELRDVTGPDEYHERVNNNAYTNWMAAHTLDVCLLVHRYLAEHHPDAAAALVERLDLAADLAAVREVASGLFRPSPDPETGLVEQFEGYFRLEDVALDELLGRKLHPHEYLGGGAGLATTTQIIKQADVVLGLFLFEERFPAAVKAANWEFYEPRTEHGSSLSACSYSLIAAQMGRAGWAYDYFMKTASIDLTGDAKQYVGPLYIGGTHPAANGGAWMSAVFGLCGIRWTGDSIDVEPHLPPHWRRVRVPLTFRGRRVVVTVEASRVSVEPAEAGAAELVAPAGDRGVAPAARRATAIVPLSLGGATNP